MYKRLDRVTGLVLLSVGCLAGRPVVAESLPVAAVSKTPGLFTQFGHLIAPKPLVIDEIVNPLEAAPATPAHAAPLRIALQIKAAPNPATLAIDEAFLTSN